MGISCGYSQVLVAGLLVAQSMAQGCQEPKASQVLHTVPTFVPMKFKIHHRLLKCQQSPAITVSTVLMRSEMTSFFVFLLVQVAQRLNEILPALECICLGIQLCRRLLTDT